MGYDQEGELHSDYQKLEVSYVSLPLKRLKINPVTEILTLFHTKNVFSDIKFDALVVYGIRTFPALVIAGKLSGVKKIVCIVNGSGRLFQLTGLKGFFLKLISYPMLGLSMALADFVFFQNPDDLQLIKHKGLLWKNNYGLIDGSGVNLEKFKMVPLDAKPVFTMICRVTGAKGVNEYIHAAKYVKALYHEAVFQLIGRMDDDDHSVNTGEFEKAVREGHLQFIGQVDDVRPYLAKSRVFVLPSYYREGVPRTNLEAMAMGRPIITTDWPGCRETVVDGVNGFLVPIRDANALAEKMIYLIEHPDDAARMGRESRRIAEDKFDIYKINEKIIQKLMS
jgi:glycosyltransferase involved in cell wall biosynthesis